MADGESGFEFRTGAIEPLVQAIRRALATPAEEARGMGSAGRRRVLENFGNEKVMSYLVALYDELLPQRRT
jgi:glycosyltransferase involved in cell wall biosynthesis